MPALCFLLKRELNNTVPEAQMQFLKQKQKRILKEKKTIRKIQHSLGVLLVAIRKGPSLANFPFLSCSTLMETVFRQGQNSGCPAFDQMSMSAEAEQIKEKLSGAHYRRRNSAIGLVKP